MTVTHHKLGRLTPVDLAGLALAYVYLLVAGWRIFIARKKLDPWLARDSTSGHSSGLTEQGLRPLSRRARWVNAAARRPYPWAHCLQRSLALCIWLERKGFRPDLKIGVMKEGEALKAHAWVEYHGKVINDRADVSRRFVIMNGSSPGVPWAQQLLVCESERRRRREV